MNRAMGAGLRKGWIAGLILIFALGLAGCEEDDSEVKTPTNPNANLPEGEGTLDVPYIMQANVLYTAIPIGKGGSAFMIAENVPAGLHALSTASAVDINLGVGGFSTFFGDEVGRSATPDSGVEQLSALGDGVADLYFTVDGSRVFTAGATFDISIAPGGSLPAAVTANLGPCAGGPISGCESVQGAYQDFDLGMAVAPGAPLSITISSLDPNPAFFRTRECRQCGGTIPFTSNGTGLYGPGYCHKSFDGVINPATCSVSPVSGFAGPTVVRIVNNNATGQSRTISFSSP